MDDEILQHKLVISALSILSFEAQLSIIITTIDKILDEVILSFKKHNISYDRDDLFSVFCEVIPTVKELIGNPNEI